MLYGHGDDIYTTNKEIIANFSTNVWYGGPHKELYECLHSAIDKIGNYPEPNAAGLGLALAGHHGVDKGNILVANGATEAIYLIAQAWQGAKATIFVPTFAEYEDAARSNRIDGAFVQWGNWHEGLAEKPSIVFICNPNNPTGSIFEKPKLLELLQNYPETVFVVDEAYSDFTEGPIGLIDSVSKIPNLIVLKSLTKTFAVPGVRIGYVAASKKLIDCLMYFKAPWTVNALAIEVGLYIVKNYNHLVPPIGQCLKETKWFRDQLGALDGFRAWGTNTTYFLMECMNGSAIDLKKYLLEEWGILVRDASNFRGLNGRMVRLATQSREHNELLLNALASWKQ